MPTPTPTPPPSPPPTSAATPSPIPPPVPWRYISGVQNDATLIYYPPPDPICLPLPLFCPPKRQTFTPPNPYQTYINQPSPPPTPRTILLLVNAHAGAHTSDALSNIMSTLHRVFSEAHLRTHVQHSQHPTHIHDLLIHRGFPSLYSLSAVVAVGGDGTLHHLINGLLAAAKQSEKPIHWPSVPRIAVIPTGTGNAVAESLKLHTPLQASLNIVHALRFSRFQKPLALMRFTPEKGDTCVCVGGIQWGLPADVDFGTENIRWLGDFRFHIGALCSILKRRVVTARIEVTVHRELNDDLWRHLDAQAGQTGGRKERGMKHGLESVGEDRYILDGSFILGVAWNCTHLAEGFVVTPHAKVSELGVFDFVVFNGGICRREALAVLMNVGGGEFMNMTDRYKYFKARSVKFEKLNGRFLGVDGECRDVKPFELKMAEEDGKLCILDAFSDDC